jgi:ABC-type transport system substrate-binding protein
VTFSNGNKFTAEDVKYTLQKAVESTFSGSLYGCIDLENTTITNDSEIVVKLKYAYAPLLDLAGLLPRPASSITFPPMRRIRTRTATTPSARFL